MVAHKHFSDWSELDRIHFTYKTEHKKSYDVLKCQNIMTFDIECSNGFQGPDGVVRGFSHKKLKRDKTFYDNQNKLSLMYVWQFGIENDDEILVFSGRTWRDFIDFKNLLAKHIDYYAFNGEEYTDYNYDVHCQFRPRNKRVKAWVGIHNESYEFQHLRNVWEKEFMKGTKYHSNVFARTKRSPMKFNVKCDKVDFEYRDTYVLVGMSLKAWTKDLEISKLDEPEWFYLPVLTPETPLSQERIEYSINDVASMIIGLKKYRDEFEDIFNIPLTQTGIVRRQAIDAIVENNPEWSKHCAEVTFETSIDEYFDLVDLFAGGWTHANSSYTNKLIKDVSCVDFSSSYPACMTTRTFPYSKFEKCTEDEYDFMLGLNLKDNELPYHYWLEFEVDNVHAKTENTWWSSSKTIRLSGEMLDNGKIYHADKLRVKMTDLDFDVFRNAYTYENLNIIRMYKSEARHLPKELIELILTWYSNKTAYKNVKGKEDEYASCKRSINSIYGCMVTRDISDEIIFTDKGWDVVQLTEDAYMLKISQKDPVTGERVPKSKMWTMYQTGVWVTAWARHNLWDAILELDERVCYCDTDSIKGEFNSQDMKFIDQYNQEILKLHDYMSEKYDINIDLYRPVDPDGVVRPLGIFADDGFYKEFKTLGAKRYCSLEYNKKKNRDEIHTTIAGLPKSCGAHKITELGGVNQFNSHIKWGSEESHKLTSYYNDDQPEADWVDMNGNVYHSKDKYGLCLMPTSFDMSVTDEYEAFYSFIQTGFSDTNYFEPITHLYLEKMLDERIDK